MSDKLAEPPHPLLDSVKGYGLKPSLQKVFKPPQDDTFEALLARLDQPEAGGALK